MKTFQLVIRMKTTEGNRNHVATMEDETLEGLIHRINENMQGRFFAVKAASAGVLKEQIKYTAIINSAEVQDIVIHELME